MTLRVVLGEDNVLVREGVRALLIDKDNNPNWHPTNPAVIGDAEVEAFFEPLPVEEQWRPFDF